MLSGVCVPLSVRKYAGALLSKQKIKRHRDIGKIWKIGFKWIIMNGLAKKDEYLEIHRDNDIIHPFSERLERIKDAL
jgi:hypothetical protein